MNQPLWDFDGVPQQRRQMLLSPRTFDAVIERIVAEVNNVRYKAERGNQEAKGWWRPVFLFDVEGETFDYFFNSPYGYRGQYFADPVGGQQRNAMLVSALAPKLIANSEATATNADAIRRSLEAAGAKIWIEESQLNPESLELLVQVSVPSWRAAATAARAKFERLEPHTQKELDRIYGVRAPVGKTLKVMGAWVERDGAIRGIVPSKERRGEDIQAFGIS
jgi:hypothetical protein